MSRKMIKIKFSSAQKERPSAQKFSSAQRKDDKSACKTNLSSFNLNYLIFLVNAQKERPFTHVSTHVSVCENDEDISYEV